MPLLITLLSLILVKVIHFRIPFIDVTNSILFSYSLSQDSLSIPKGSMMDFNMVHNAEEMAMRYSTLSLRDGHCYRLGAEVCDV